MRKTTLEQIFLFLIFVVIMIPMALGIFIKIGGSYLVKDDTLNYQLVSIKNDQGINGQFYVNVSLLGGVGGGSISTDYKYITYVKTGSGYILKEFNKDCIIYEDDNKEPSVVITNYYYKTNRFDIPLDSRYVECEITIPKNSIITNYELNLN